MHINIGFKSKVKYFGENAIILKMKMKGSHGKDLHS